MKTKLVWANLSVKDLEQTHVFYTKLGFRPNGEFSKENGLASFLVGQDDFVVHFFEEKRFKWSIDGEIADLDQGNEVMFTLSADSKEEVDEWAEAVKKAGGTVFSEPQAIMEKWYGCGFADLDGHKWNVFYNGK
ncbi:VOC family protein [Aliifodinibius salicampi]|uniref:VOC family protein n=1 Tax=Fodinibius salicampi TaxID=1920655 RepID=A0ABT3PXG3_9BACT|nr:VOC family protein [Fodinibius salicampi]MCW9712513.1 VOC family protein [Fodinibius salicampi]